MRSALPKRTSLMKAADMTDAIAPKPDDNLSTGGV
jgi:hypothetical protein